MKDFKKFMYIHYETTKFMVYSIFIIYIVFFLIFLNDYMDTLDKEVFHTSYVFLYIALILVLGFLGLYTIAKDKKFLKSLPVKNFNLLPLSIILYYFLVSLLFIIPSIILGFIAKVNKVYEIFIFIIIISLFISSIDLLIPNKFNTKRTHHYITAICIYLLILLVFLNIAFNPFKNININAVITLALITSLILFVLGYFKHIKTMKNYLNNENEVHNVQKEEKHTNYENKSKYITLFKLLNFNFKFFINNFFVMPLILIVLATISKFNDSVVYLSLIPAVLIHNFRYFTVKLVCMSLPIDFTKIIIKDRIIKLTIFFISTSSILLYFYMNGTDINTIKLSIVISLLFFSAPFLSNNFNALYEQIVSFLFILVIMYTKFLITEQVSNIAIYIVIIISIFCYSFQIFKYLNLNKYKETEL